MPITPTGRLSLPLENLRTLLAACASWQSWTGTVDPTTAAEHVYLVDLPQPQAGAGTAYTAAELTAMRPLARVDLFQYDDRPGGEAHVIWRDAELAFVESGKLMLDFVADVLAEYRDDSRDAKIDFLNHVGAALDEMIGLSGTNSYLSIHKIEIWQAAARSDQTEGPTRGDTYRIQFLVHWGI